jgi:hypothetical protein
MPYIVGIMVAADLDRRLAYVLLRIGSVLMIALVAGTAVRNDWPTPATQMLYALVYYVLLRHRES